MYTTRPPVPGSAAGIGTDWGIRQAVRIDVAEPARSAGNEAHARLFATYMGDMLRPYRLRLDDGALTNRSGQSYGELAEAVIDATVTDGGVDLLVLAYAIPDITPGRATATYLSHVCPGHPMAFAITDQGTAAAFTAVRLIRDYTAAGVSRNALLIIAEQAELAYDPGVPAAVPLGHAAVGLLFGPGARSRPSMIVNRPDIAPGDVSAALSKEIAALGDATSDDVTLLLGASLAPYRPEHPGRVRVAADGRPYTGAWSEVAAAGLDRERIIVADYDPGLGYLSVAAMDPVAAQSSTSTA